MKIMILKNKINRSLFCHGNSEIYKDFKHTEEILDGTFTCPSPTDDFEPCCWRAGEIVNSQCIENTGEPCEEKLKN